MAPPVPPVANRPPQKGNDITVLKLVSSGIKVAGAKRFVAKESFAQGNKFYLWDNFNLYLGSKIEENVKDERITLHHLKRDARNTSILKELAQRKEITLGHFFDLIKRQSRREKGHLLIDGQRNIAYIRGIENKVFACYAIWPPDGFCWILYAIPTECEVNWNEGDQILSYDC